MNARVVYHVPAAAFDQLVGRLYAHRQVRMFQIATEQLQCARLAPVGPRRYGFALAVRPAVHDAPDPATLSVTTGVGERNLVVSDYAVIKIRNVQRAVGP